MKVGIVGSRSFNDYKLLEKTLNELLDKSEITAIVSGGAVGADSLAEQYANLHGIKTLIFKPDWSIGKRAAAIRNQKIINESDLIIAFWDGVSKGTQMTMSMAKLKNIKVLQVIYTK